MTVTKDMTDKKLPVAVCALVNEVILGTHKTLDELFKRAGAPGEPPEYAHGSKWKIWLMRASDDSDIDAHQVLGKIIEEFMEVEPSKEDATGASFLGIPDQYSRWEYNRARLVSILSKNGLKYLRGGQIVEVSTSLASEELVKRIKSHDFEMVDIEFRRAIETVSIDPETALTAGCALLEAVFKAYLEDNERELPQKQTIKQLWKMVQKEIGFDPKNQTDSDIQRILSGMSSIVDGVGALRTHAGSAHGRGRLRYRVQARHARLCINSAHTLALFLIETWEPKGSSQA